MADWPLERVVLNDGKEYRGLIESETPTSIEFAEVHRPRGKPMFLVVRVVDRKSIASWARLSDAERQELRQRLESHKHRALIESRRMEDLVLQATRHDGTLVWQYQGAWFSLESTAAESMTRRSIVRLEQIFSAYHQILPPRFTTSNRLHVRIFGASEQYHNALQELGLAITNPAVYLPDKNLILAGSDMNRFDAELSDVNHQHRQARAQFEALMAEAPARLKALNDDLKKGELPAAERQKIVLAEQKKWEEQRKSARRKLAALDRKNAAKFNEVAGTMFMRLAHEAFHAYLETFVYPRQAHDVPRWLNEGLAQIFEAGLLEADTLRTDTPNLPALTRLQSDLRSEAPLELANLLNAGSDTFLISHAATGPAVSRSYYYSWGLAYYLTFDSNVLGSPAFDEYLSPAAAHEPAVARFEKLVGMPLSEFEKRWREAMLQLKTTP
ncbi:MAG TPA: DUF1570 domain-containing protein [Pirellulales bacterium]|nr:DUF1570 domain-containing protein [Pirellulales bacterium]